MREQVQHYYGEVLKRSSDLRTSACTTDSLPSRRYRDALARLHPEVVESYYGCGLVYPPVLEGCTLLDLGCGTGRDCYVLSQFVGPEGHVVGIDMTPQQLEVALRHRQWHAERFGHPLSNVEFLHGYLETLDELPLAPGSFDVIVSNCVINLALDKAAVLRGAWRLLKPGGELYFADVYADRRVPQALARDPVLYGECLGGALYWNDFLTLARAAGFADPRLVTDRPLAIEGEALTAQLQSLRFYSATWRLFKLEGLEPACEDYGQAVTYNGGIEDAAAGYLLDKHHFFERGKVHPVCGNTLRMLRETRLSPYFEVHGSGETHYGLFEGCGASMPFSAEGAGNPAQPSACC